MIFDNVQDVLEEDKWLLLHPLFFQSVGGKRVPYYLYAIKIFSLYFPDLKVPSIHSLYKDYLLLEGQNSFIPFLTDAEVALEIPLFLSE